MALKLLNNEELNNLLAELLSDDNKDRTLGELDNRLSIQLSELKKMIDLGIIDYSDLQKEISKYIDINEQSIPGSVSQLLKGCLSSSGSCPINRDNFISYTYDVETHKLISLSNDSEIKTNSKAVIYLTGAPSDIKPEIISKLHSKGFSKLTIKFKDLTMSNYETEEIENLEDYLSGSDNKTSIVLISIIIGIIAYLLYRRYN